jgi:hypothetical protein
MALCWDPPVTVAEVTAGLAAASPGWVNGDVLRDPASGKHQVFLAAVPELCCFGFILTDVLPVDVLTSLRRPFEGDADGYARTLNSELSRIVSTCTAETSMSDHHARVLGRLVAVLEQLGGDDLSFETLTDDLVLESWKALADANRATAFAELLRQLAALTDASQAALAESAESLAASLDDPTLSPQRLSNELAAQYDSALQALALPLIDKLLSHDQARIVGDQMGSFAPLVGLDRSRMRASTFRSLENQIVQGKRDDRDLHGLLFDGPLTVTHGSTLALLRTVIDRLDTFIHAALYLLEADARPEAARTLAANLGYPSDARSGERFDVVLATGRRAWDRLRHRVAFMTIVEDPAAIDEMAETAIDAAPLRAALTRLYARLDRAVDGCREGAGFVAEYQVFCEALAHVHGVARASRNVQ